MAKVSRSGPSDGEFALIAQLARELTDAPRSRAVELGIGDDAALLRVGKERLVVSVDDQIEMVHFDRHWLTSEDIGYRALQAAASDLAAMGATPIAAVVSLHVPRGFPAAELGRLARGQAQAARKLGCPVVGGNVARASQLSLTTTVLGRVLKPLLRSGGRPGDELWVIGELGLARAGLLLHQQQLRVPLRLRKVAARARAAWARPEAQIAAGQRLVGRARAVIDVSDGLAGDVQHLAAASGVKAVVEARALTGLIAPELAVLADLLGEPGAALALRGGEDYALLCAGPGARRPAGAKVVGRIERGSGSELELETGQRFKLGPGFDHLRG
ncbi:MAG TPA: thiamine-phosphate kinase [Polyangiaceae bacterium]|nr:thiamine-phosphate kinase [Polyangiaceae bacterium]